jgi:hypothetical protein
MSGTKTLLVFGILIFLLVSLHSVQGYQLTDNMYFAMPNNTIECIEVTLPDDSGFLGMGEYEYIITSSSNWSDLTEQIVRTDVNNTVTIPICFSGFGRSNGNCSPPFKIGIASVNLGIQNQWDGGICISRIPDVDISDEEPVDEESVREILDQNVDIFDIGFSPGRVYTEPDKNMTYSLLVQSQATLTMDLVISSPGLSVTPSSEIIHTSPSNPLQKLDLTVQIPPGDGEYMIEAEARIRNCEGIFCIRTVRGVVVVNESLPDAGFLLHIFPGNINIKNPGPVMYSLTIQNYGKDRIFSVDISMTPDTATTDLHTSDISMLADSFETIEFSVTPQAVSTLYEIDVSIIYEGVEKKTSAVLSTNEMLTDAMRGADYLRDLDPGLDGDVNSALNDWYNNYSTTDYGSELGDYATLRDAFHDLEENAGQQGEQPPGDGVYVPGSGNGSDDNGDDHGSDGSSWLWTILPIIVIVVVVVIALVVVFKKSQKSDEDELGQRYF